MGDDYMYNEYNVFDRQTTGTLNVFSFVGEQAKPITGAKVSVMDVNGNVITTLQTDKSGQTQTIKLPAPKKSLSLSPVGVVPYAKYNVKVESEGHVTSEIKGVQIFADIESTQPVQLTELGQTRNRQIQEITISDHALLGKEPKLSEEQIQKEVIQEMVPMSGHLLDIPRIPSHVIVHDGHPNNNSAPNYRVDFKKYITNVACSEIYPGWPIECIKSNVHCIVSFTLNRVYTEFYRGKGRNFTITSSTRFDHKYNHNATIFSTISNAVNNIFDRYISTSDSSPFLPFLAQYCDGKMVTCPNWLSQWGSKYLADLGKNDMQILQHYYGSKINLFNAPIAEGNLESFPGQNLQIGSTGKYVNALQQYINKISQNYPEIGEITVDGSFGPATQKSVKKFQSIFKLPQTGIVDSGTWYKISDIYVAVMEFAKGIPPR
ncbi:Peptidoglycan-binding domain 1 protein [Bacillus thuringiensis IBL 200]|uniref:Peptidoglycan-binding protein n=2 Tax=Bacillus thuringiensis TaxID=1428 RepID=A0ABD5HQP5_BACTU|nr:Peptidoglycan-binding domain 1 protein [Bacillus thuringiensis IBL 200]MDW9207249.1 Peptidoglycan-binding protein [Bacillus thuringiensis serovar toumanoffi]PFF28109.1 peptidoglycan-binding protein [Bacillus thuringiensis]OTZ42496.1 peptidoglycan-binding protein [Bacillus thuringiensis serovar toumanoffi]PFT04091.1 peptidoglycan-binding protein [Bacillus thuringiensis]